MSNHPFTQDLSKISQDELDKRHGKLLQRYHSARRMGMNNEVIRQLELFLDDLEEEKNSRLNPKSTDGKDSDPVVIDTDRDLL